MKHAMKGGTTAKAQAPGEGGKPSMAKAGGFKPLVKAQGPRGKSELTNMAAAKKKVR